jgi:8-oxo-dGTP diphosphatase
VGKEPIVSQPQIKKQSATIIFVRKKLNILLFLRDNNPNIPFPNCWDLPGGHVESGETPEQCIIREMKEEIGYKLKKPILYKVYDYGTREDHLFYKVMAEDLSKRKLTEGQDLRWYSVSEIEAMPSGSIAFGYKNIILEFTNEFRDQ